MRAGDPQLDLPGAGTGAAAGRGHGRSECSECMLMLMIPRDGKENIASAVTLLPDFPFVPPSAGSGGKRLQAEQSAAGPCLHPSTLSLLRQSLTPQGLEGPPSLGLNLRARLVTEGTENV